MKILYDDHISPSNLGGIQDYNAQLLKNLATHKFVNLIKYSEIQNNYTSFKNSGIYRLLIDLNSRSKKLKPDILHCTTLSPIYTEPNRKYKIVTTIHDLCFLQELPPYKKRFFNYLINKSIVNSDHIITTSEFSKKQIQKHNTSKKVSVIYQGIDIAPTNNSLQKFDTPYILFPGNITKRKQPELLNNIATIINDSNLNIELLVSGKNLTNIHLHSSITTLEFVEKQKYINLIQNSLAIIYTSSCEGFGRPIIEAGKLKKPIISTPIATIKEISDNNILYANNPNEFVEHISKIINKKYPKTMISKHYKKSILYSWDDYIKKLINVYHSLLYAP